MHPTLVKILDPLVRWKNYHFPVYQADGFSIANKNTSFLRDKNFEEAWSFAEKGNQKAWAGNVPDIRWRAHIACWAAENARGLEGDFVECGVFAGLISMTVMKFLLAKYQDDIWERKKFYLFDTFQGIPKDETSATGSMSLNDTLYNFDSFDLAKQNFSKFANAELVKGVLPQSIDNVQSPITRICYLHMDLNHAGAEISTMERLWPLISPGAVVLIDDYGFSGHEIQYEAWNKFAASHNVSVATLPTGQGILLKPPT